MNTNIPTPRTDKSEAECGGPYCDVDNHCYSEDMRQLERELHEANLKTEEARRNHFYCNQELHESRQREERFVAMISTLPTRIAFDKNLLAFTNSSMARVQAAKEIVDLHFSKALSTTPAETMVPWSVVKEYLDAREVCSENMRLSGYSGELATKRCADAKKQLQSYAPKQKGQP